MTRFSSPGGKYRTFREDRLTCRLSTVFLLVVTMLLLWPFATPAQLLSHIEVYKENDIGVIHILLNRPVIYTRHFPPDHSYLVHIYFNDMTLEQSNMGASMHGAMDDEFMRSPPTDIVPLFWITYSNHGTHDAATDPYHLMVQFGQPVHYKIVPDEDNQGFYIFVLSVDGGAPTPTDKPKIPLDKPKPTITPTPPSEPNDTDSDN